MAVMALTVASYPSAKKSYSANIEGITASGMKKASRINDPRLRYRPHRRRSLAPKACDVKVSWAMLSPIIMASIIIAVQEIAKPTTATLMGSAILPAKMTIVILHINASMLVTIAGPASLTNVPSIFPVEGCGIFGSKKSTLES